MAIALVSCGGPKKVAVSLDSPCPKCNIVLISLDTLRADHLGIYGYDRHTSPNIDRIATSGVTFDRTYAQAPWTLPSHVSMLTGLYPSHHKTYSTQSRIPPEIQQIPQYLRSRGYATAAFTGGGFLRKLWGYRGFDTFWSVPGEEFSWSRYWEEASKASTWIRKTRQPFFLFWHTYGSHAPYIPDIKYDLFSNREYSGVVKTAPGIDVDVCGPNPKPLCTNKQANYYALLNKLGYLGRKDLDFMVAKYDGEVREADAIVGYLWKVLSDSGKLRHTIFIVTSDHGEMLGERIRGTRRFGHPEAYDEVIHVPWIMWWPKVEPHRDDHVVESIDILPTALRVAGLGAIPDVDGTSVMTLTRNSRIRHFAVVEGRNVKSGNLEWIGVVTHKWHLIDRIGMKGDRKELFDLLTDPYESTDVASTHKNAIVRLKRLESAWVRAMVGSRGKTTAKRLPLKEATRNELRALGYL